MIQKLGINKDFQGRLAAALAVCTTIFFMCIENAKAFMSHQAFPTVLCNLVQTSSVAAWVARFPTSGRWVSRPLDTGSSTNASFLSTSINSFLSKAQTVSKTKTSLSASWSFSDITSLSMSTMSSSSLRPFGSWYNEVDHRVRPPVYDDATMDYSFSSPTDTWPTFYGSEMDDDIFPKSVGRSSSTSSGKDELFRPARRRPIRALRRAASRAFRGLPIPLPGRSL